MYNVNYDDERFKKVENEKQSELDKYNQTYDNLINERNNFTNQQQQLVNQWENTQKDIANQNLQYQKDLIEQQRNKAEKEYQNEAKASYIDYQKEVDKYGVSRENVTANGLSNSGYSESSKVDMYNTYQNRLATARKSLEDAGIEFDNAIREAQMSNNETLAQNALKALQDKLNIALDGFNYKTEQENNKLNWNYNINNNYYNRYKDVESQINYENETAEKIRQYNENMAYQKEQQRLEQERWEQEMAYQKQQDAIANAQKWASMNNNNYSYNSDLLNGSNYGLNSGNTSGNTDEYGNTVDTQSKSDYYFQDKAGQNEKHPQYINNQKVVSVGKASLFPNIPGTINPNQNIWRAGDRYYLWEKTSNTSGRYIDVTSQYKYHIQQKKAGPIFWGR